MADLLGVSLPEWKDGMSFLPSLTRGDQLQHEEVVFAGNVGPALVTPDGWKARYLTPVRRFQLFYLPEDYREDHNLAAQEPAKLKDLATRLLRAYDGNMYHSIDKSRRAR